MKVGIAGAGAVAMGYAALLQENGHCANVWSPSGSRTVALLAGLPLQVTGAIEGDYFPGVCVKPEELAAAEVIIVALPAYGHRSVLDRLSPYIGSHHIVVISGHLSFAALYLAKLLAKRGIQIPIAVWNTTVLTSKARAATEIRIGVIRGKVDMATVPVHLADRAHAACVGLFGDRFVAKDDLLTVSLSNLNPQNHMGIALCNLTRIEHGETWGQNSNITPTVGRLLEALDRERVSIAEAFGKTVRSISDHYSMSFGVAAGSVAEMSTMLVERGSDPAGPRDIQTRYVLEDVPFGLVPTMILARVAGIEAPLHNCGIEVLGACYGRDFSEDNDLLAELGPLDMDTLLDFVANGYPSDK